MTVPAGLVDARMVGRASVVLTALRPPVLLFLSLSGVRRPPAPCHFYTHILTAAPVGMTVCLSRCWIHM